MEMKERQRWRPEEDALLSAYVKQYGPRDLHLVSNRMNRPLNRDPKSCLERWKNYLKPGLKKGSLTEDEQRLVIHLQAKHGNKWKKIAAEVPGRTAKRLGKWWEVFKDKQQREQKESEGVIDSIDEGKYDRILENFAEKLVKDRFSPVTTNMSTSNGGIFPRSDRSAPSRIFRHSEVSVPPVQSALPPWLANSSAITSVHSPSPSVTLSLSPSVAPPIPWLQADRFSSRDNNTVVSELQEVCRELEEGQKAWAAHRKEAAWRLKRVELQLESEKACRKKEKMEETEAKVKILRDEEKVSLDMIEVEYRDQLAALRKEAEVKEQKLAEQWAAKHTHLTKFLDQMGCRSSEANGR